LTINQSTAVAVTPKATLKSNQLLFCISNHFLLGFNAISVCAVPPVVIVHCTDDDGRFALVAGTIISSMSPNVALQLIDVDAGQFTTHGDPKRILEAGQILAIYVPAVVIHHTITPVVRLFICTVDHCPFPFTSTWKFI
jgi:hypothetical protein